ncbi:uncharacterized protein aknad1 isoform 2-T2 [Odontesthes bonariensis]|uniref:uncharacterized protein aknad1 isoform X2 n=1 Tax=Odontesthes bonariensis TaxID=219752 RepID=UPI003F5897CC
MEGDSEESEEDVQGEDKPTVLWERCIEQSIIVDLSEDESLHLSDLESSLALHMSQAESATSEASIHLNGSAELSELDDTSSESSAVSSKSVKAFESNTKSRICHVSAQRPNTEQDEPPIKQECEDSGQNTSDEDQEDLPYDGNLGSRYFNQIASSEGNSDGRCTVLGSPDLPGLSEWLPGDVITKRDSHFETSSPTKRAPPRPGSAHINHLLLRHLSQEELLLSGRLIEAEILPEVSLLESVDDPVLSLALTRHSKAIHDNHTESSNERSNTASKNVSLGVKTEKIIDDLTSFYKNISSSANSNQSSGDITANVVKNEKVEEDDQIQRVPLVRTRSFSELKYGQGQVHYPLPDFSKVAPKVKIPKAPSGPIRSVPQSPRSMHGAQSSPEMLEVISRVLEDSVQPPVKPYVFKDNHKQTSPVLVHNLQAEYDKLLTKYAQAENLIDQMRLGTNTQPSSETFYSQHDDNEQVEFDKGNHLGLLCPHLSPSEDLREKEATRHKTIKEQTTVSSNQHDDGSSDGGRMTAELIDIIGQFMQKVEEFKFSVSNMAVNTAEKQMMLRRMMEAQDQLERKYISKKEEHRALEMQSHMGLTRNTGTFDPHRLVEGDIFRIGMHLEDIKEMIDKNMYEQISPPQSSSTPNPITVSLHVKPDPLCMPTLSPPPSLHEGARLSFPTVSCKTDAQEEEVKHEEVEKTSELHGGSNQSSELITVDRLMKNTGRNICHSRDLLDSVEGPDTRTTEDEEGNGEERSSVLSAAIDHSDIVAYLRRTSSNLRQTQRAANSGVCDLGDCMSLAVKVSSSSEAPRDSDSRSVSEPPLNSSYVSQRIVSPETDSGFGSSYLNQSPSGTFQPNLTGSVQSQSDGISRSDSEGSCSNLQTAIPSAALTDHQWASPHTSAQLRHREAAAAVELWVESTTKEPSVRLQGTDQKLPPQLKHYIPEPVLSTAMDTVDGGSPLRPCSCNGEAILALQSEVSRLKTDLEEGLVQLPQLAQRMDYLTSKYTQEGQGCRSKTRSHQTPAISREGKSSDRGVSNLSSSQLRIEDWISSDMDPSKSKGTVSSDASCQEIMLQDSSGRGRRGKRNVFPVAEFQDTTTQSNKGTLENDLILKEEKNLVTKSNMKQRPQTIKSFYSKDRWSHFSIPSLQKPLLQVSYGSSSSLPARTASKTSRRRGKKEEDINRTLDQAIEVARTMKWTTDRMARRLSADLAKAQLHRKLHNMQPLGGRKHQAS